MRGGARVGIIGWGVGGRLCKFRKFVRKPEEAEGDKRWMQGKVQVHTGGKGRWTSVGVMVWE